MAKDINITSPIYGTSNKVVKLGENVSTLPTAPTNFHGGRSIYNTGIANIKQTYNQSVGQLKAFLKDTPGKDPRLLDFRRYIKDQAAGLTDEATPENLVAVDKLISETNTFYAANPQFFVEPSGLTMTGRHYQIKHKGTGEMGKALKELGNVPYLTSEARSKLGIAKSKDREILATETKAKAFENDVAKERAALENKPVAAAAKRLDQYQLMNADPDEYARSLTQHKPNYSSAPKDLHSQDVGLMKAIDAKKRTAVQPPPDETTYAELANISPFPQLKDEAKVFVSSTGEYPLRTSVYTKSDRRLTGDKNFTGNKMTNFQNYAMEARNLGVINDAEYDTAINKVLRGKGDSDIINAEIDKINKKHLLVQQESFPYMTLSKFWASGGGGENAADVFARDLVAGKYRAKPQSKTMNELAGLARKDPSVEWSYGEAKSGEKPTGKAVGNELHVDTIPWIGLIPKGMTANDLPQATREQVEYLQQLNNDTFIHEWLHGKHFNAAMDSKLPTYWNGLDQATQTAEKVRMNARDVMGIPEFDEAYPILRKTVPNMY
jgi:hypothetical protein